MVAKYSKEMIQPGAQGEIEIQHHVQDARPGLFRKIITILTSDGAKKRIRLSGTISDEIPTKQRKMDKIEWYRTFENGKYGATTIDVAKIIGHTINLCNFRLQKHSGNRLNIIIQH